MDQQASTVAACGQESPPPWDGLDVHERIHRAMHEVSYVAKGTEVDTGRGKYRATSHDDVVRVCRPALLKWGLVVSHTVTECHHEAVEVQRKGYTAAENRCWVALDVTVRAIGRIGEGERCTTLSTRGSGFDSGDKALGKAISYAKKYGLLLALLLETGDDADHDASHEDVITTQADRSRRRSADEAKRQAGAEAEQRDADEYRRLVAAFKTVAAKVGKEVAAHWWQWVKAAKADGSPNESIRRNFESALEAIADAEVVMSSADVREFAARETEEWWSGGSNYAVPQTFADQLRSSIDLPDPARDQDQTDGDDAVRFAEQAFASGQSGDDTEGPF